MRRAALVLLCALALAGGLTAFQATPQFLCSSPSGFGAEAAPDEFYLDLQCQPALARTLEIQPGASARFTVSLSNYYAATGQAEAAFEIHLAMDRGRLMVRQAELLNGELITDTLASLQNVAVISRERQYTFVIENRGLRSAVFDLTVRPRRE